LQCARILDQPHDVIGDELLRADRHVDGERAILVLEQLAMLGEVRRTNPRDARSVLVEQAPRDLARGHVHFVAVGQRDEDVRVACTRGFQDAGLRRAADNRADVDAVLQVAQQLVLEVHHGDFVGGLPGQVIGRRAADLAGAQNDYFHSFIPAPSSRTPA
jgi:hypothetical protein